MKTFSDFKWSKIGKDRLIIGILIGLILLVIAIPLEKKEEKNETQESRDNNLINEVLSTKTDTVQEESPKEKIGDPNDESSAVSTSEYGKQLEKELEEKLLYIDGVGKTRVMLTMKASGENVVEKDSPYKRSNVSEIDSEGGNRNSVEMSNEESTIYMTDSTGNKVPYVVQKYEPEVEGVLVIAQGGDNSLVKQNISEAIVALFGIEAHKIKVVKMRGDAK